jgi:hypothetical protein
MRLWRRRKGPARTCDTLAPPNHRPPERATRLPSSWPAQLNPRPAPLRRRREGPAKKSCTHRRHPRATKPPPAGDAPRSCLHLGQYNSIHGPPPCAAAARGRRKNPARTRDTLAPPNHRPPVTRHAPPSSWPVQLNPRPAPSAAAAGARWKHNSRASFPAAGAGFRNAFRGLSIRIGRLRNGSAPSQPRAVMMRLPVTRVPAIPS